MKAAAIVVHRIAGTRSTVYIACALSLLLGLFFLVVWSPLPWGWHGIDFYDEIARQVAAGRPFPTMHLVWGYVGFLAFWYWLAGDRPWVPLLVQVLCNATIPYLLYRLVRLELGERIAIVSAALAGILSFNTVYASTQASDAMCTVLFLATVLAFTSGRLSHRLAPIALSGALAGLVFQFRPNFVLFPFFLGGLYLARRPFTGEKLRQVTLFIAAFVLVAAPWIVRNYRWSGLFVPASTHGGKQFWFGSLQVGQYRENWLYNPRAAFEFPAVDYSSVDERPPIVTGTLSGCAEITAPAVDVVYWTNRDPQRRRLAAVLDPDRHVQLELPAVVGATAFSYYADARALRDGTTVRKTTPADGEDAPLLFVLSRDHLGDLDLAGDALDVFDLVRMLRYLAWQEPLPYADRLDLDGDGVVGDRDVRLGFAVLADVTESVDHAAPAVERIDRSPAAVVARLVDGSTLGVARAWSGRVTDIDLRGEMAQTIVGRSRTFPSLRRVPQPAGCLTIEDLSINRALQRRQPHEMRRFTALALDNIRREPLAYLAASGERAVRLFVIAGGADRSTAVQFRGSPLVYAAGTAISVLYLLLWLSGIVIARARRLPLFTLVVPTMYVPLTICFMLINARYAVSIQPFTFGFIAVVVVAILDRTSTTAPAAADTTAMGGRQ